MTRIVCLSCALLVWLLLTAPLGADMRSRYRLTVRVYNTYGVERDDLRQATDTAGRIFSGAGVELGWRECQTPSGPSAVSLDACREVPGDAEVLVRLIAAGQTPSDGGFAFGYSLIDTRTNKGTLSTIFPDRVQAAAVRVAVPVSELLGRTLAHELGHLFLGSSAHSRSGLMQAHWPDRLLRGQASARHWTFARNDLTALRASLERSHPSAVLPVTAIATRTSAGPR